MDSTVELIHRVRQGDTKAAEDLCHMLLPEVRQVAFRFRARMDPEDLVQETMIRILGRIGTLREESRLLPWARRIAWNMCISALRRQPRTIELDDNAPYPTGCGSAISDQEDALVERVILAIGKLPVRLRESARQAYLLGIPQSRIAERLQIPIGTVKSRLSASRGLVRAEVETMSSEQREAIRNSGYRTSVTYQPGAVRELRLRGYGMYFGSVLEVGDIEEVLFLDYPGPVPTMAVTSEVRRKIRVAGTEAFEVYIRHGQVEPAEPPVIDCFSIDEETISWLMRASTTGNDPHLEFNDGSSRWLPMPRAIGGSRPTDDMILRVCVATLDGRQIDNCISCLDVSDAGSPAERIYRADGRQILHRRYIDEEDALKRELPWESLPFYEQAPNGIGTLRRWYDSVLVKPAP